MKKRRVYRTADVRTAQRALKPRGLAESAMKIFRSSRALTLSWKIFLNIARTQRPISSLLRSRGSLAVVRRACWQALLP